MHMLTKDLQQTEELSQEQLLIKGLRLGNNVNTDDFILQNFQNTHPNDIFPSTKEHRNVLNKRRQSLNVTFNATRVHCRNDQHKKKVTANRK